MKLRKLLIVSIICFAWLQLCRAANAQPVARTAGLVVRGTFWDLDRFSARVHVLEDVERGEVRVGGGGGWLVFFSRLNEYTFLEFGIGAIGTVEATTSYHGDEFDAQGIVPVVFGVRHQLVSPWSRGSLQPYVGFGGGPYWLADVQGRDSELGEEVIVSTDLKPGAYLNGGAYFMLSSWFGLNFDVKYHYVNLNVNHERSGYEYGLGVSIMWGRYNRRYRR